MSDFLHESRPGLVVFLGMEQPKKVLENGTAVVTCPGFVAGSTEGLAVSREHLDARSARTNGKVTGTVPGTGDEVYLVKHDVDGRTAAYFYTEFVLVGVNGAANKVQAPVPE